MERKQIRNAVLATFTVGALALTALPAGASRPTGPSKEPVETHCLINLVDDTRGESGSGSEICFDTEREVDEYINGGGLASASAARYGSNVIGKHYKGKNYGGSSVTIVGTTCAGGVWWPTGSWNNNIESAKYYCGGSPTRFYDSSSCSGSNKSTYSNKSTLGWMNNKTSCVRYG